MAEKIKDEQRHDFESLKDVQVGNSGERGLDICLVQLLIQSDEDTGLIVDL